MSIYSEILGINRDDLSRLSKAYAGYGLAIENSNELKDNSVIASSYLISAIYKTLIEPGTGSEDFNKASKYYRFDGNDFWIIPAICSGRDIQRYWRKNIPEGYLQQHNVFEFFLSELSKAKNTNYDSYLDFYDFPVGSLKIPFKFYANTINELHSSSETKSLKQVLLRASEYINLYKNDDYHWKNLNGCFLPIEPEILAFCICALKVESKGIRVEKKLSQLIEIDSISEIPLLIAEQIMLAIGDN